jgi:glycosyltransferase involved in cell wall biosynthesis
MKPLRILHVVADHSEQSPGVRAALESMVTGMAERGHDVVLAFTGEGQRDDPGIRRMAFARCFPRRLYFSRQLKASLPALAASADVVHVHSNWTFPVWWGCHCAVKANKPLIHSPHGSLNPNSLRHRAWKKKVVASLDRHWMRRADALIASSEMEREAIGGWMGGFEQIRILPLGVDVQAFPPRDSLVLSAPFVKPPGRKVLFCLGRLHPLKGLDLLLDAFADLCNARVNPEGAIRDWDLVIAGPDEQGTRARLERQIGILGLTGRVRLMGPLDAQQKIAALHHSDILALPSRSESFGLVVAEAMACGVPVLTTTATPWGAVFSRIPREQRPGWICTPDLKDLKAKLEEALSTRDEVLREMSRHGERLIHDEFSINTMVRRLEYVYEEACRFPRLP